MAGIDEGLAVTWTFEPITYPQLSISLLLSILFLSILLLSIFYYNYHLFYTAFTVLLIVAIVVRGT